MTLHRMLVLSAILALPTIPALAHEAGSMQGMSMPGMNMQNMMGMHDMTATVSSVDTKTGIVEVAASGMNLKLHFPPASLASVKAGDNITVHLAFTKP